MSAFFEKRGLGAEFDKRIAAARGVLRRDRQNVQEQAADADHPYAGAARAERQDFAHDGAGWIERLAREIGYDRVERAFYVVIGGVIFAGCVAIVAAGFRGQEPAQQAVEGVTEVQLAPPAQQQAGVAAPPQTQSLAVQAPAPETAPKAQENAAAEPAPAPPAVSMRDNPVAAQEAPAAPPPTRNESVTAEAPASEMPPASEAPRESEMAMAAPEAATEETPPPAAETEAAPSTTRDAASDDKASAAKCFLKVSGRVIARGECQVSRKGAAVTFLHSGQPVTLSPLRGREWSLSLGGRKIGTVYKVGGCWGSRKHTWICEKGA